MYNFVSKCSFTLGGGQRQLCPLHNKIPKTWTRKKVDIIRDGKILKLFFQDNILKLPKIGFSAFKAQLAKGIDLDCHITLF